MKNISRVDIFEAAQDLVDKRLEVGISERLTGPDDGREIAFHELWGIVSDVIWRCSRRPYPHRGSIR